MPTRSRLQPEQRRMQIVQSAARLFAERPYADVSVSEIAAGAGVTRALVHHYFKAKRDLYGAVIRSLMESIPDVVRTDDDVPVEEKVAFNTDAALTLVEKNRETMLQIMRPGVLDSDPELATVIDQACDRLVDRIILNNTGTLEQPPQVRLLIRGYLGLFAATVHEWLVRGRATRETTHLLLTTSLTTLIDATLPVLLDSNPLEGDLATPAEDTRSLTQLRPVRPRGSVAGGAH